MIRAAKNATKTIPIVMVVKGDPVEAGLVESLARPGGNITGFTNLIRRSRRQAAGAAQRRSAKLARVAVLYKPINPADSIFELKEVLPVAARALKLTVQPWEVRGANDFERHFAALNKERPDGLYVLGDPLLNPRPQRIADFALKSRLPSMYCSKEVVDAGGLMSYGADYADSYRRAAILRG